jgi:hypothetical protein
MAEVLTVEREEALSPLTENRIIDQMRTVLEQFWLPPHQSEAKIEKIIRSHLEEPSLRVIVSGETDNISLYILSSSGIFVLNPFSSINSNFLLQEVYGESLLPKGRKWYIFPPDPRLIRRLTLPKVMLVNPCVLENFPVPRLSLSIGLLAGYLRKYQKADVRIVDMQMGATVEDIVDEVLRFRPILFGLSISFGQKDIALSILDGVFSIRRGALTDPLVVLGNIIPAAFPSEFLERYPNLIVAYREGELTIKALVEYLQGERELESVPGITYRNELGYIQSTPNESVPMASMPLPSLDTINDLARCKGALTLELSRGCQWNACTFCPREHKSGVWKTFSTEQILDQFTRLGQLCDHFGLSRHVFLADEEFVGGMNDGLETERIAGLSQELVRRDVRIQFDAAARVDQVYSPGMGTAWHVKRMEMWHLCKQAGLDRLFLGIESGSNAQLQRYGKGIRAEHAVIAIRVLSSLGIPLRFGFIMFDQLMIGLNDLRENIAFLERTDAFMNPIDVEEYGYERLFELLLRDRDFIAAFSASKPIYAGVSYMLATMEVLINSRYKVMLKNSEKQYGKQLILDKTTPDTNMARYRVEFVDDLIKDISVSCQKWIDRHFGVAYAIKSAFKVAPEAERKHLMDWMVTYRRTSLLLVKALVAIFDENDSPKEPFDIIVTEIQKPNLASGLEELRKDFRRRNPAYRAELIEDCLNIFDRLVEVEIHKLKALIEVGSVTDTAEGRLKTVLNRWRANIGVWMLINDADRLSG